MKVTVDANILFACLIKESFTRKLWFDADLQLFAPRTIIAEFLKYQETIKKKYGDNQLDFDRLLDTVIAQLRLVPDSELKPFVPAAASLLNDEKDWLYLACALKENTIIWSNDAGFKEQSRIEVRTTAEMMKQAGLL